MDDHSKPTPIISSAVLERWHSLNSEKPLAFLATRPDFDNFFLSCRESMLAQEALAEALRLASRNEVSEAQKFFDAHKERLAEAFHRMDHFIAKVMQTAVEVEMPNGR